MLRRNDLRQTSDGRKSTIAGRCQCTNPLSSPFSRRRPTSSRRPGSQGGACGKQKRWQWLLERPGWPKFGFAKSWTNLVQPTNAEEGSLTCCCGDRVKRARPAMMSSTTLRRKAGKKTRFGCRGAVFWGPLKSVALLSTFLRCFAFLFGQWDSCFALERRTLEYRVSATLLGLMMHTRVWENTTLDIFWGPPLKLQLGASRRIVYRCGPCVTDGLSRPCYAHKTSTISEGQQTKSAVGSVLSQVD